MARLSSLPNLVLGEVLRRHLAPRGTLVHARECRRVCRRWHDLLEPAFWRCVSADAASLSSIVRARMPSSGGGGGGDSKVAEAQWAALIVELHVWVDTDEDYDDRMRSVKECESALASLLPAATNLKVLHCVTDLENAVALLAVRHCRRLTSLEIQYWQVYMHYNLIVDEASRLTGSRMEQLDECLLALFPGLASFPRNMDTQGLIADMESLTCYLSPSFEQLFLVGAAEKFPRLRRLMIHPTPPSFSLEAILANFDKVGAMLDALPPLDLPVLYLHLFGTEKFVKSVVRHTPRVRSVQLHMVGEYADSTVARSLSAACPRIEYLRADGTAIACESGYFPNLKHLRVAGRNKPVSWRDLGTSRPYLRSLILSRRVSLDDLDVIAASLPSLTCVGHIELEELFYSESDGVRVFERLACFVLALPGLRWIRIRFSRDQSAADDFDLPWLTFLDRVAAALPLVVQTTARVSRAVWRAAVRAGVDFWPPSDWTWPAVEFDALPLDGMAGRRCHRCTNALGLDD
ncbi:hypothetical protein HK405_012021 [Cladochytrium tenue]|nr:hypothetical protein HK405_012021 [Cladochytrium tenue]